MIEHMGIANQMIISNQIAQYEIKEIVAIIIAALAFVLALGGVAIAALVICGWKGSESTTIDWIHGKATFECRR